MLATLCLSVVCVAEHSGAQQERANVQRHVTVADAIRMTRLGVDDNTLSASNKYLEDQGLIAHWSPNHKLFFIVLRRGNIEDNTNIYSLYVYTTALALAGVKPPSILTLAAASNEPAILNPKWLADNATITFIGQKGGGPSQVYEFNIATKQLKKLTEHPTAIRDYETSANGQTLVLEADLHVRNAAHDKSVLRKGVVITSQSLIELVRGHYSSSATPYAKELFVKMGRRQSLLVPLHDEFQQGFPISVSPDGRYAIFPALVRDVPEFWSEYDDHLLHPYVTSTKRSGEASRIVEYFILDIRSNTVKPLMGTPWSFNGNDNIVWSPDGASVVVSGARLPLNIEDVAERQSRRRRSYVVEVSLRTQAFTKVTDRPLRVLKWTHRTHKLLLTTGYSKDSSRVAFQRSNSGWKESSIDADDVASPIDIVMEEDMNTSPKLYVVNPATHEERLLWDLNRQFTTLKFGRVESVSWKATDGHEVSGGLYLPPDFVPGNRYPVVIQTHGFFPDKFWIDGPWSSAFAAQPLAGKGIIVLQVGHSSDPSDDKKYVNTPQEGPRQMAAYEGAIDYLDSRGLVDRSAVGLIGFSRTVYYVAFTLTHSKYQFAAATLADGVNGGYFVYRALPDLVPDFDSINGGPAVGQTLAAWMQNSPSFNLDKVNAPVRIEAYGPELFLGWEWFAGLSTLGKPVEFIYLPVGQHELEKPWERLVSQQGNVDWFTFWLKREEDPDPAKAEQYGRWRELRALRSTAH